MDEKQAKALRVSFPPELVETRPGSGRQMLEFVGHATTTDRLLQVDPDWSWHPMGLTPAGLPAFDDNGGLWIILTVCGVSRPGYGDAGTKQGPNAVKEAIGDALRNAAMRFGVALDLWAKADLHAVDSPRSVGNHAGSSSASPSAATATTTSPARTYGKISSANPPGQADTAGVALAPSDGPDASTPPGAGPVLEPSGDEHRRAHETASTAELKLDPAARKVITPGQAKKFRELAQGYGLSGVQALEVIREQTGKKKLELVERYEYDALLAEVEACGRGVSA